MKNTFIYTETTNARIVSVCTNSFHRHHDREFHIITTPEIFANITPHKNNVLVDVSKDPLLAEKFMNGIEGVAHCYGKVLSGGATECKRIIHVDGDVFFKGDCITPMEQYFDDGYGLMATRRTYELNPGKAKGFDGLPDLVSTYLLGVNLEKFSGYDASTIASMYRCQHNPCGHPLLDTFDAISHVMLGEGVQIKYMDYNLFGGQNEYGKKNNLFNSNLHFDVGLLLCHFAGVESGFNFLHGLSPHAEGYGKWCVERLSLFSKIFFGEDIPCSRETKRDEDGRWISGAYDQEILDGILNDMGL